MIQGTFKNLIPLVREMLKKRTNNVDIMYNMLMELCMNYLKGSIELDTLLEIDLKTLTYKRI